MRRSHLPDQIPGEHTGHKGTISWLPNWHGDPIQNAHIPPLAITARYQFYTLVRWGRHEVHILPKDVTWSVNWHHWDSNPGLAHSESHTQSILPPCLHRCVWHLLLRNSQQSLGLLWHVLWLMHTIIALDRLWPVNLFILFTLLLELVILNLNAMKGHIEFWGNPWCYTAPCM